MKRIVSSLILAVTVAACAEPGVGEEPNTTTPGVAPTLPAHSTTPRLPISNGDGVAVIVTGTLVEQPDGSIEMCPPGMNGPCPGIVLEGELDPTLVSSPDRPNVIEVEGRYDGRRLAPTAEPAPAEFPLLEEPDFSSFCPDLVGDGASNPSEPLTAALSEYAAGQDDFAGMWWDQDASVMTVWFVGDDLSEHQGAIAGLAGGEPVCVAGGARFSEAELIEASEAIQGVTDSRGRPLVTAGYGIDTIGNQIPLSVEELDPATRSVLTETVGERVVLYPFIEMTEGSLADLPAPVPVVTGDVEILTSPIRYGGGMAALGTFDVGYDTDLNCVYFTAQGDKARRRLVPLWPFGYSAVSGPLTIYDYDGNVFAGEGETVELGGGSVPASGLDGNLCEASESWVVNR